MDKMEKKVYHTWEQLEADLRHICREILKKGWKIKWVYGPPRGGCIPAVILSHMLNAHYIIDLKKWHVPSKTLIVDDVSDTGGTLTKLLSKVKYPKRYKTATIFIKEETIYIPNIYCRKVPRDVWIVYSWEID
jgi:hypoxanthine phosphoribosyltransferase